MKKTWEKYLEKAMRVTVANIPEANVLTEAAFKYGWNARGLADASFVHEAPGASQESKNLAIGFLNEHEIPVEVRCGAI